MGKGDRTSGGRLGRVAALLALLVPLLFAAPAEAYKGGFPGLARGVGCTCHGFPLPGQPTPTTRLFVFIDGELAEEFAGYRPGGEHVIELWVLGPIVPFAGFNLDVTAGELSSDGAVTVYRKTECGRMSCTPGAPNCGVVISNTCPTWESGKAGCGRCTPRPDNVSTCRPCDDSAILESEATHSAPAPVPAWTFTWRPPATDVGPVKLYAVGNSVSGEGQSEIGDMWNFLDPNPIVIPPAP